MSAIRNRIRTGQRATGTTRELGEWIVECFQEWTPKQQEQFRRETMIEVRQRLREFARRQWEAEFPQRPYDQEPVQ